MEKRNRKHTRPLIVSLGDLRRYEIRCNGFCIIYCYTSTVYKVYLTAISKKDTTGILHTIYTASWRQSKLYILQYRGLVDIF